MRRVLMATLVALVAASGAAAVELSGRIVDQAGEPVARAFLLRPGAGEQPIEVLATSEEDGRFAFELDEPGWPLELVVSASGYARRWLSVASPDESSFELRLEPEAVIAARLLERASGEPLAGVAVGVRRLGTAEDDPRRAPESLLPLLLPDVSSDARGRVRIGGLEPGAYQLRSASEDWWLEPERVVARVELEREHVLTLAAALTLRGRVLAADGKSPERATVALYPEREQVLAAGLGRRQWRRMAERLVARAGPDGRFEILGVETGFDYELMASAPGWLSVERSLETREMAEPLEIVLRRGLPLRVVLRDQLGSPLPRARLELERRDRQGAQRAPWGRTDEAGLAELLATEGRYRLHLRIGAIERVLDDSIELVPGEDVLERSYQLDVGERLSGVVISHTEQPIAGARVIVTGERLGRRRVAAVTAEDGGFDLVGLEPGDAELLVVAEGYSSAELETQVPRETPLRIVLGQLGRVSGRVLLQDGRGADSLQLIVGDNRYRPEQPEVVDGGFELGVEPGSVTLAISAPGHLETVVEGIEVEPGKTSQLPELRLEAGRSLRGRVLAGGVPLAGAEVALQLPRWWRGSDIETRSDVDGSFVLEGLRPGSIDLVVSHAGWAPAHLKDVPVPEQGEPPPLLVELEPGAAIEGRVGGSDGLPRAGVDVVAYRAGTPDREPRIARSGEDGRYRIGLLAPGGYFLQLNAREPGVTGRMRQVELAAGQTLRVDFGAEAGTRLHGVVLASGEPGADWILELRSLDAGFLERLETRADDAGRYAFEGVPAGRWRLLAFGPGPGRWRLQPTTSLELELEGELERRQDLEFEESSSRATLTGVISDAEGRAIADARVQLMAEQPGMRSWLQDESGSDGGYRIEAPDGSYELIVSHPDYLPARLGPLALSTGEQQQVDVLLERGLLLTGRVSDSAGRPLSDAVVIAGEGFENTLDKTDLAGRFELQVSAPSGQLHVLARGLAPLLGLPAVAGQPVEAVLGTGGGLRIRVEGLSAEQFIGEPPLDLHDASGRDLGSLLRHHGVMLGLLDIDLVTGEILMPQLAPGVYTLQLASEDGVVERQVQIVPGVVQEMTLP